MGIWTLIKILFIPYEKFTVKSSLAPKQIRDQLSEITKPEPFEEGLSLSSLSKRSENKPYSGTIDEHGFHITPTRSDPGKRFLEIHGKIYPTKDGALVNITLMPNPVSLLFLILAWIIGTISVGGLSKLEAVAVVSIIAGFIYIGIAVAFRIQATLSKSELEDVLKYLL